MPGPAGDRSQRWWEGAVVYQIYPRSFADSNGDGVGDLRGVIEHLDHLRGTDSSLGVDAIWLSPFYPSPLHDFGYDISDYRGVAAEFGTLDDFDKLVAESHARGLGVILDLVPCHTSIDHPWFIESRASRTSPKRDWYIWADRGAGGGPPNNWRGALGGSAWELDAGTGQYYHHSFYPEQPDLNWRNPEVADAVHDAMRFWFERGVDGFRVDAIAHAIKDELLRDNPKALDAPRMAVFGSRGDQEPLWNVDRPEVHDVVRGLRRVADAHGGRILIGEIYTTVDRLAGYLGMGADDEFHLAWNFELLHTPWKADAFALAIERAEAHHPAGVWPSVAFSNHDNPRHATRWGRERSRVAALILLSLRGVPTLYMGEEVGMIDHPSLPANLRFDRAGRDAQRTPMQWDATPGTGFTAGTPWLPAVDPADVSVAAQSTDPDSLLSLYRRLIALRRDSPALRLGVQRAIFDLANDVLAWTREAPADRILVIANLADGPRRVDASRINANGSASASVLLSTDRQPSSVALDSIELAGLSGLILRI